MCLSNDAHAAYSRLARAMDDEQLEELDRYYREDLGRGCTTVDMELHGIVRCELEDRHEQRIRRFERALWLSSRRGRLVEAIRHWLVRRGLWSSARSRVVETSLGALPLVVRLVVIARKVIVISNRLPGLRVRRP